MRTINEIYLWGGEEEESPAEGGGEGGVGSGKQGFISTDT